MSGVGNSLELPDGLSATDVESAIRVGRFLSKQPSLFETDGLRELRKAWGPLMAKKAQAIAKTMQESLPIREKDTTTEKKRAMRRKERLKHDRKLLETRRLRAARMEQMKALQMNPNSEFVAIPDGAVDDGVNTSFGMSGGTENVVQVLKDGDTTMEQEQEQPEEEVLFRPRSCYICKARFYKLHHFYDQLCESCAALNWEKRIQTADLSGMTLLLTGGRVKIGYQIGLKCLRMGARLIVTTRFVADCALRYGKEKDFKMWSHRLMIHGLDFRDIQAVERFAIFANKTLDRLDGIINNACQTVRRPPVYYRHLLENERSFLNDPKGTMGTHYEDTKAIIDRTNWHTKANASSSKQLENESSASSTMDIGFSKLSSAEITQMSLLPEDKHGDQEHEKFFPQGQLDVNAQQVDMRTTNSWTLTLSQVQTAEAVEVLSVNAVAPMILNAKLKDLMMRTKQMDEEKGASDRGRYIINVSAMEGKFYRYKNPNHPHTNMAKAALNMMTRTSSSEYAQDGIFMNAVDTGWINDENPLPTAARISVENNFQTPIDEVDAAARVIDPILVGVNRGERFHGLFLKDYRETFW